MRIDKDLKFNKHIFYICCKATRQINVLSKLHSVLDQESRLAIYRNFILSNFNYCPVVWHFCGIKRSQKMTKMHRRALRFVYTDYVATYKELLAKGNHSMLLYISRKRIIATEVYKALNELNPKYLHSIIEKCDCDYNLCATSPLTSL